MTGNDACYDDEGRLLPAVLESAQMLPTSTRHRLVVELASYGPPADWRDKESFYRWLRDHYEAHGTRLVDAALRRKGSNDSRRTLIKMSYAWMKQRMAAEGFDEFSEVEDMFEAAREHNVADVSAIVDFVAILPGVGTVAASSEETKQNMNEDQHDEVVHDDQAIIASARALLDRLEIAPEPTLLGMLREVVLKIAERLDETESASKAAVVRDDTIAALLGLIAAVSDERRGMLEFAGVGHDAATSEIEIAMEAIEALIGAESAVTQAQQKLSSFNRPGPERRQALSAKRDAEDDVEVALEQGLTALRRIAVPDAGGGAIAEREAAQAAIPVQASADHFENELQEDSEDLAVEETPPSAPSAASASNAEPEIMPDGVGDEPAVSEFDHPAHDEPAMEPLGAAGASDAGEESAESEIDEPAHDDPAIEPLGGADASAPEIESATAEPPAVLGDWDRWVAESLDTGRLGLAVHFARARDMAGATAEHRAWPAPVIEAVLAGRSVETHADRAASLYDELAPELIEAAASIRPSDEVGHGMALALLAGAIRASLVTPYAGTQVITALRAGGTVSAFIGLLDFSERGPQLNLDTIRDLAPAEDRQARETQNQRALAELDRWYQSARTRSLAYAPATGMWQRDLITPNGKIGKPIDAILAKRPNAVALARALVEELRDRPDDMLDDAFDAYLVRSRALRLEAAARERCLGLFEEARELVEAWLATLAMNRETGDRLDRPRADLQALLQGARLRLVNLRAVGGWTGRGAALLDRSLSELLDIVEGRGGETLYIARLLDNEIALLPSFPLNGRRRLRIEIDDVEQLRAAARVDLAGEFPSWWSAFERALEIGAASVAHRLLPLLDDREAEDEHRLAAMEVVQRRELGDKRASLRNRLDDLQTASTADYSLIEFEATLVSLGEGPLDELPRDDIGVGGAINDFPVLRSRLDLFEQDLEAQRRIIAAHLERRIETAERQHGITLQDCRTLLEAGDLGTLAEDLGQIEEHGPDAASIRPPELLAPLRHFVEEVLAAPPRPIVSLCASAHSGEAAGAFRFDRLPQPERTEAGKLIDSWIALKRAAQDSSQPGAQAAERELLRLLGVVGFGGSKVVKQVAWRGARKFEVRTDPVRSSTSFIIPAFASLANGHYTIVVVPPGELGKCLQGFNDLPTEIIVLVTEWLSETTRDLFLRTARQRPAVSAALIDEATLAALAATPGRSLRHLFDLGVPFGAAHPYVDTSLADAAPSIEMFFGRQSELQQLEDPQGSCLVYGGRQLGKTALLKQIELRNATNPDLAVVFLSIENVGRAVESTAVWDRLSQQLYEKGVLAKLARGGQQVCDGIREWLAAVPTRRLLMLLDEADNFLEHEINDDFKIITIMRQLMETTSRRAKFVFAGLHNVQRFVRTPNSPMLHLGDAVQIGPLLGRDRDAARRMVFEPMAAVGIGFCQTTDAHHMLSLVGYYPSLLQTFGKTIIAHVSKTMARTDTVRLPRLLERKDITDSFQDEVFRKQLFGKFDATLQLDPRYELITYAVCYRIEEDRRSSVTSAGYTEAEIRRLALEYWPQGFTATSSPETFGVLLDEMVGLGVLNREGERYTLRSARIAAMLGGSEKIFDRLLEFSDRSPEEKPDPMANHRGLSGGAYSPLSLRQEKALVDQLRQKDHGSPVILMAGSEAVAAPEDLKSSIVSLVRAQDWPEPRPLEFRQAEKLRGVVAEARREAREGKPRLVLCQGRWPTATELADIARWRELRDAAHPVRVLFMGGPQDIVQTERSGEAEAMRATGATIIEIRPWDREAILHWLTRHCGAAGSDIVLASNVLDVCGGFTGILDACKLPSGTSQPEVVDRVRAAAEKVSDRALYGIDDWLGGFVNALEAYGGNFTESDLVAAARDVDEANPRGLVNSARRLNLLREVQRSGEPRFDLNPAVLLAVKAPNAA